MHPIIRFMLVTLLASLGTAAGAADCKTWHASKEEGEGGSRMVARVCNAAGGSLTVECGERGKLMMAFTPAEGNFAPPQGNPDFVGPFSIRAGSQGFERDMAYWAMEGAMGMDFAMKDPLAEALGKGETITFASVKAGISAVSFPLAGAPAALKTLKATCPR
jgi:hypothetical protein